MNMDIQEFKQKVITVQDKLFRLAKALLKTNEDAEDAIQEVFLKLWNMRTKLSEYRSVEALAVTMTKNICLDKIRTKKNKNFFDINSGRIDIDSGFITPYKNTEAADSMSLMYQIIEQLPAMDRYIVHLRDVEGYEYEEIEELTGINVNAIRVKLSRARKSIRDMYLKINEYEGSEY